MEGQVFKVRRMFEREIKRNVRSNVRTRKKIAIYFNTSMMDISFENKSEFIVELKKIGIKNLSNIEKITDSSYSGWTWTTDNYAHLFKSSELGKIVKNTFVYVFLP